MQKPSKIDVFIFSKEKNYFSKVQEARLRRNLKSSLELNNVKHITNPIDENIKIVHYLNFEDCNKFNYFKNKNFIKVVSVFLAEGDKKSRLIQKVKNKNTKELENHINKKNIDILNSYDYVFAPSDLAKEFLEKEGVITRIKTLLPTVKLSKISLEDTDLANLAYIYFHLEEGTKYFFIPLDYVNKEAASTVIELANKFKNYRFVVATHDANSKEAKGVKKVFKKHPGNVIIVSNMEEDVYFSTIYRCSGFILLNDIPLFIEEIMDAFAAKKPIFALKNSVFNDIAIDKVNAHVYNDFDSLVLGINEFDKGNLTDLTDKAYEFAYQNRVQNTGKKLIKLYNDMLEEKNIWSILITSCKIKSM